MPSSEVWRVSRLEVFQDAWRSSKDNPGAIGVLPGLVP